MESLPLLQEGVGGGMKTPGKDPQLNVGDKPLARLDPLYGVLVDVDAKKLHLIGQHPLGDPPLLPQAPDGQTAEIISAVPALVDEHKIPSLTFSACHFRDFMLQLRRI